MFSEVRTTKEGGRFLWVAYNNTLSNWSECIADAHNKHPGCRLLTVIAESDSACFRIGGEPVLKVALEPSQAAPGAHRNNFPGSGVPLTLPGTHDPKNGPKTPYRGKIGGETKSQPAIKGRQISFNNLKFISNMDA
jgi:hypothetical protein